MLDWLWWLLDTSDFVPRWHCGAWSPWLVYASQAADLTVAAAYFLIPLLLWIFWRRRRDDLPSSWILLSFAAFILFCGVGHLFNAMVFWWPAYRLYVLNDVLTAASSVATAIATAFALRSLLDYPTPEQFRRQAEKASLAEAEAERRAAEAVRLRELADQQVRELRQLADRLSGELHLDREAQELRARLAKYRREVGAA